MSFWRQLKSGIRALANRDAAAKAIDDETSHYLDELTSALEATGTAPDEARRKARVQLGSLPALREEVQDGAWETGVTGWLDDCRHAARRLVRSPGFLVTALVTLALGVGGIAALCALIDSVLLRPLPYPDSEQLVALVHTAPGVKLETLAMSPSLYFTYKEEGKVLEDVALWNGGRATVTRPGEAEEVHTLFVTHEFLHLLRIQPALGRDFSAADDDWQAERTVLLAHAYWQQHFGGSSSVQGQQLTIDGNAHRVIGVLPASFEFLDERVSLVVPKRMKRDEVRLISFGDGGIARLKPGVGISQLNADLARCLPMAPAKFPLNKGFAANAFKDARIAPRARPLKEHLTGDVASTLWPLLGAACILLLIACANVANLMLVRADGRHRELAVRAALGANWSRLARELLVESVMLGLLGGAFGLVLCAIGLRLLTSSEVPNLPRLSGVSVSPTVLAFTLAVSGLAGLLFGLIPVWRYARPRLAEGMHSGSARSNTDPRERRQARGVLVVIQVALAMVLLVGAGLMMRSLEALQRVNPGFSNPEMVQAVRVAIPAAHVPDAQQVLRLEEAVLRRFEAIPGVSSVAIATAAPMEAGASNPVMVEGRDYTGTVPPVRRVRYVSPGFATSIGSRMVAGRDMRWDEVHNAASVVLVSESLAREVWGSSTGALGKRIRNSLVDGWSEVIGVVNDLRDDGLRQPAPTTVYWPMLKRAGERVNVARNVDLLIRSQRSGSTGLVQELKAALAEVDPNLPLANIRTLESIYRRSLARSSFTMLLLAIAAVVSLVLGVVGLYGVVAYAVSKRSREIGIRLALGSSMSGVVRVFLLEGLVLAGIGVAIGAAAAAGATRLMSSLLFEVNSVDPLTYGLVTLALIGSTALASWLPARHAAPVNPVDSLRAE